MEYLPIEMQYMIYTESNDLCKIKFYSISKSMYEIGVGVRKYSPLILKFDTSKKTKLEKTIRKMVTSDSTTPSEVEWALDYFHIKSTAKFLTTLALNNKEDSLVLHYYKRNANKIRKDMFIATCANSVSMLETFRKFHTLEAKCIESAILKGNEECVIHLYVNECSWGNGIFPESKSWSNSSLVSFLYENKCPLSRQEGKDIVIQDKWDSSVLEHCGIRGNLTSVKFFHEEFIRTGQDITWDKWAISRISRNGHLNCLKYFHENGCQWVEYTLTHAIKNNHIDCVKYIIDNIKFDDRIYIRDIVLTKTASEGNIDLLLYLADKGCNICADTYTKICEKGDINTLKRLHEASVKRKEKCYWSRYAFRAAAICGSLDCIKYLYENGCPFGAVATSAAAKYGHLDCLKFLYENGCSTTVTAYNNAVNSGYTDCVEYLISQSVTFMNLYIASKRQD